MCQSRVPRYSSHSVGGAAQSSNNAGAPNGRIPPRSQVINGNGAVFRSAGDEEGIRAYSDATWMAAAGMATRELPGASPAGEARAKEGEDKIS